MICFYFEFLLSCGKPIEKLDNKFNKDLNNKFEKNLFKLSNEQKKSLDEINYRYGVSTLRLAAEGIEKSWQMRREKISPCYTTSFDQLMNVKS